MIIKAPSSYPSLHNSRFSREVASTVELVALQGGLQSREFSIFVSGALAGVTSKTLTAPIETVR